jgi:glycosyltransferase involved in cell wall biosynthesis
LNSAVNNEPLVSVLMTAYNREKYIEEAIKSVLASTYINFELIIVDDCSSDKTLEIAYNYSKIDSRIKVFVNETNIGDYPNRNKAASYANGKYLKYIDADDLIYPYGLDIMVKGMEYFPDAGWGISSTSPFTEKIYPIYLTPYEIYKTHYFKYGGILTRAPLAAIIKRDVFNKEQGFKNVRHYGDSDMWHRLAMYYPVVMMQSGLIWWRAHNEQEAGKRKKNIHIKFETINNTIQHIIHPNCPLLSDEKQKILKKYRRDKISLLIKLLAKFKLKQFMQNYKL